MGAPVELFHFTAFRSPERVDAFGPVSGTAPAKRKYKECQRVNSARPCLPHHSLTPRPRSSPALRFSVSRTTHRKTHPYARRARVFFRRNGGGTGGPVAEHVHQPPQGRRDANNEDEKRRTAGAVSFWSGATGVMTCLIGFFRKLGMSCPSGILNKNLL